MATIDTAAALLVVDVQNDFCPGGPLAVPDGDAVVPVINKASGLFPLIVATQDWHPEKHISFASRHPGKEPFSVTQIDGTEQVLWPDHCVAGTKGAEFHPDLDLRPVRFVVRKGAGRDMDSYSAFLENDHKTPTGLTGLLHELGVKRIFVAGLATDYCVRATAVDGCAAGFQVTVVEAGCRAVDQPPGSLKNALAEMRERGVTILPTI